MHSKNKEKAKKEGRTVEGRQGGWKENREGRKELGKRVKKRE